jgi:hypothetical protein
MSRLLKLLKITDHSQLASVLRDQLSSTEESLHELILSKNKAESEYELSLIAHKYPSKERIQSDLKNIAERFGISMEEAKYFTINCDVSSNIYDNSDYDIEILYNDGSIRPITEASDILNIDVLSKKVKKHAYAYIR